MTLIALIATAAAVVAYLVVNPQALRSGRSLQLAVVGGLALVVAVIPITIAHLSTGGHLPLVAAIAGPICAYLIGGVIGAFLAFADLWGRDDTEAHPAVEFVGAGPRTERTPS